MALETNSAKPNLDSSLFQCWEAPAVRAAISARGITDNLSGSHTNLVQSHCKNLLILAWKSNNK